MLPLFTISRRTGDTAENAENSLRNTAQRPQTFSFAPDRVTESKVSTQLGRIVLGLDSEFTVAEERFGLKRMKSRTTETDLMEESDKALSQLRPEYPV